jgi:hypothetical protein
MTWPSSPFSSTEMPLSSTTNWPTENDTIDSTAYDDLNSTVTEPMTTTRIETTIPITSPSPRPTKISMASSVSPRDRHRYNVEDACILQHVRTNYITPLIWWMVLIHSVLFFPLKKYDSTIQGYARMGGEIGVLIGVALYLGAAAREARFLGRKMFFENLVSSNLPLKKMVVLKHFHYLCRPLLRRESSFWFLACSSSPWSSCAGSVW